MDSRPKQKVAVVIWDAGSRGICVRAHPRVEIPNGPIRVRERAEAAAIRVVQELLKQTINAPRMVLGCTDGEADYVIFLAQSGSDALPRDWAFVAPSEILKMAGGPSGAVTWPAVLAAYHLPRSAPAGKDTLPAQSTLFALKGRHDFEIGIKSGDLLNVRNVDLWANPENTAMEMDRFNGQSISSLVRYAGAEKDSAGNVVADTIAQSLSQQLGSRTSVPLGTVMRTTAGELAFSNDVHALLHVAAVEARGPGMGFRACSEQISRCMTSLLEVADVLCSGFHLFRRSKSLLVPLLGAGQGGLDAKESAEALIKAMLSFVETQKPLRLRRVWLMAHTPSDATSVQLVLEPHVELSQ